MLCWVWLSRNQLSPQQPIHALKMDFDEKIFLECFAFPNYKIKYQNIIWIYTNCTLMSEWIIFSILIVSLSDCGTGFSLKTCIKLDYAGTDLLLSICHFSALSLLKEEQSAFEKLKMLPSRRPRACKQRSRGFLKSWIGLYSRYPRAISTVPSVASE